MQFLLFFYQKLHILTFNDILNMEEFIMLFFIMIIIVCCIVSSKNKQIIELQHEIKQLKDKIKKLENSAEANNIEETINEIAVNNNIVEEVTVHKKEVNVEERKNVSILITGSVLIVLSAIVFLTTAWNAIPNIIKTITLVLFVGIFLGASKIAKEKFHLEKASKTFFYIAMAYLPICFLSIAIFGLFGEFLSIWGEGRFLYLGMSSALLAILYYTISKKDEENYLLYGSILSQLLTVILFSLLFDEKIFVCFVNLLIYNLLLIFMTKNSIFKTISTYIPALIGILAITGIEEISAYTILTYLLLTANFLVLELEKTHILKAFAFNFYLLVFGFSVIFKDTFDIAENIQQILMLLYMIPIFGLEHLILNSNKNAKNILISSRVLSLIAFSYIYLFSIFEGSLVIIPSFVVGLLLMAVLIYCLKLTKVSVYKYLAYSFINILLLDINYTLFHDINLAYLVPLMTSAIIIVFEKIYCYSKDKVLPVYLCVLESIALIATLSESSEVSAIIAIIYVVSIIFYNKSNKTEDIYNIAPLIFLIPNIYFANLSEELEIGIMILSSIGLTYLSIQGKKLNIYTIFSVIYLFFGISNFSNEYLSEILFIAWAAIHMYYITEKNSKDIFKVCVIIGITAIYYSICEDLQIREYTLFNLLGVAVSGFIIIKSVIAHYTSDTDIFEYIFWALIYIGAINSYTSSADGILFSLLILATIFASYYRKYGATFLASILAILANALILTRTFWLSIPWWIYLLVVGATLIGFAIKNEANENKISVKKVLKNIKESCEK